MVACVSVIEVRCCVFTDSPLCLRDLLPWSCYRSAVAKAGMVDEFDKKGESTLQVISADAV